MYYISSYYHNTNSNSNSATVLLNDSGEEDSVADNLCKLQRKNMACKGYRETFVQHPNQHLYTHTTKTTSMPSLWVLGLERVDGASRRRKSTQQQYSDYYPVPARDFRSWEEKKKKVTLQVAHLVVHLMNSSYNIEVV